MFVRQSLAKTHLFTVQSLVACVVHHDDDDDDAADHLVFKRPRTF